ncbi:SH3 domain-containing protein [Devosia ginsengisoli]|uniref:SH3 domain-containing protein n=1 Tax=Devosia ginsengisoli TaxID=400770 RepID=UPI0034E9504F
MPKKKQNSNAIGWVILGLIAFGIFQFGTRGNPDHRASSTPQSSSASTTQSHPASAPLTTPRFVNVASLNVRHSPSATGELIMTLPRGTPLRVLDRQDGWLLVDLSPTLEGWVTEHLTTTRGPAPRYMPPAPMMGSR